MRSHSSVWRNGGSLLERRNLHRRRLRQPASRRSVAPARIRARRTLHTLRSSAHEHLDSAAASSRTRTTDIGRTWSSSAPASAGWRPPCASAPTAIASPWSRGSMRPGGRAYTYHQDGFTFDAGPTIITAPYMFEELWTLCGQRMADDVELRPSIRTTASISTTASTSTTPATSTRCARRSRACRPATSAARPLPASQRARSTRSPSSSWPTSRSTASVSRCARPADLVRLQGLPLGVLEGQRVLPQRAPADGVQLPSAADRRQSVHDHLVLLPDRASREQIRRALRGGRHRRAGARHGRS